MFFCSKNCKREYYITHKQEIKGRVSEDKKPTKKQLYQEFVVERKTIKEIAEDYDLSEKMIKGLLHKHEIEKKTIWNGYFENYCHICKQFYIRNKKIEFFKCERCKEKEYEFYKDKIEGEDYVICKICGEKKEALACHITRLHGISADEYKENYHSSTLIKRLLEERASHCPSPNAYNKDEETIDNLSRNLVFIGATKKGCKRFLIGKDRIRNPDFVIITDENYLKTLENMEWWEKQNKVTEDFRSNSLTIQSFLEFNGFYWHSKNFNGRTKEEYEKDMINDYKKSGFNCLVIWDIELIEDVNKVQQKIEHFIVKQNVEVI